MKPALLVIDVQNSFKATPRWETHNNPRFEHNLIRLVQAFRTQDLPVLWFLDLDTPENPFLPEHPACTLMNFVERQQHEPLFPKTSRNCFTTTGLQQHLTLHGIDPLVITGIKTE